MARPVAGDRVAAGDRDRPRLQAVAGQHVHHGAPDPGVVHHERRTAPQRGRLKHLPHVRGDGRVRRPFRGAAKRAELPDDLHQHDLRHRRVTTWLAGGANPVHVKEAMARADLRTTIGYTHLAREHLRGLVEQPDREELKGPNESQG